MERNTCYLNLSVAEAARTVSELVELSLIHISEPTRRS